MRISLSHTVVISFTIPGKEETKGLKYELENAIWELTLLCNLRCLHCGSSAAYEREDELSTEEALRLIQDLSELGCRVVQFMGGEPLLRRDWRLLAQAVRDHGMKLRIISNAFVLDKNDLEALVRLQPEAVGISIDGASAETHDRIRGREGSFHRAMAAIDALMERGLPVTIITSLCKPNVFELDGIKDLILGRGIGWQIQVVTPKGARFTEELMLSEDEFYFVGFKIATFRSRYSPQELPVLGADDVGYHSCFFPDVMSAVGEKGCQAGVTNIGIQSNGNIKGCLSLSDEYIEGNIRERDVKEMWAEY